MKALAAVMFGISAGVGLALIPATGAVFGVLERGKAGPIVAAIFQKYSVWQVVILLIVTGVCTWIGVRGGGYNLMLVAIVALSLHGGWEMNRRAVGALRPQIQDAPEGDPLRKRFGMLHGVSVLLLLGLIGTTVGGGVYASCKTAEQSDAVVDGDAVS